ncbi:mevalonate kinase [Lactobacillus equicursoris]|uniref:mevalonate kinase n=1 Tax=Lactobacillus equicursoris TaxID=420645 RepID=UPI0024324440|nr:mevalonate kinase [Lactobacillus equicursoris]MDD6386873.1 mevalonate kinase [Lactobacillus equicursoris]
MQTSCTAHGKVILIGEHSVVYGYDALAMPIKALHIKTSVEDFDELYMDTKLYHGPFFAAPDDYNGLKYVVKTLFAKSGKEAKVKVTYKGEIPMERGFGSSATVALGTTVALSKYLGLDLTEQEIMDITNQAETINHGKASGLDAATVNSDYLVFFNKKDGIRKLTASLGATLLIMDTGNLGNTREAVTMVHDLLEKNPAAKKNMARLGQLADLVKAAWLKQDRQAIGSYFNEAQSLLASFGISTPKIDQMCQIAKSNGALGCKLSGGGLGGIVIALCDDSATANKIASQCQDLISDYWIEKI